MQLVCLSYTYDIGVLGYHLDLPSNVIIRGNAWVYLPGTAHEESYTIGEGVRELDPDHALEGPLFVFDLGNPEHLVKLARISTELAENRRLVTV